jgi:hypothetical protein
LGVAAVPIWGIPYLRGPKEEGEQKKEDIYTRRKKDNRDQRMRWILSDDMPPK